MIHELHAPTPDCSQSDCMLTVLYLRMAAPRRLILPRRACAHLRGRNTVESSRRGGGAHDALRRAVLQRLPGTLRARQAKAGAIKVDKPFACVRRSPALLSRHGVDALPSALTPVSRSVSAS